MTPEVYEKILAAMEAENYAVTGGDKDAALNKLKRADSTLIAYPGERGMAAFRQTLEKAAKIAVTPKEPVEAKAWKKALPAIRFVNALCVRYKIDYAVPEDPEKAAAVLAEIKNARFARALAR